MVNIGDEVHKIDVPDAELFVSDAEEDYEFEDETEHYEDPKMILQNAELSAAYIIEEARANADDILSEARVMIEQEKADIFGKAEIAGYEEGYTKARAEGEEIIRRANQTLTDAEDEKERLLRQIEPQAVSLVIDTIEKLAGDVVRLNPGVIAHIIRIGLNGVQAEKEISVRVSADNFEEALAAKDELCAYVDSDAHVSVVKDTSLAQGDCVIDTSHGSIDSSVGKQWNALRQDLLQILKTSV